VSKSYGNTQALSGVDLTVHAGEVVGIVGHNGAGKSTLMRIIAGQDTPDAGAVKVCGVAIAKSGSLIRSRRAGVQIAFQELSLAPTVRVFENTAIARPSLRGWGWRKRARTAISAALDEVFPGHGILIDALVEDLSLAQRQMVEIAQTLVPDIASLSLLILDEPTSALGHEQADNLLRYVGILAERGIATLLISHKMPEILGYTNRTVVLRDGMIVGERPTAELDGDSIVAMMSADQSSEAEVRAMRRELSGEPEVLTVRDLNEGSLHGVNLSVRKGEIVGIAGLDGQGQQALLQSLYASRRGKRSVKVRGRMAYVTGDRQRAGIFPLWSTGQNIAIGVMRDYARAGIVNGKRERAVVHEWTQRLVLRGGPQTPVVDLSGGNQQKALVARALASSANIVLLDDPLRGVDVETRRLMYRRTRQEAAAGRSFLWFTTENAELAECDRVLVMSDGTVVSEFAGDQISEENVISASFSVGS
jgi:ribose transport system ATP-binding protein